MTGVIPGPPALGHARPMVSRSVQTGPHPREKIPSPDGEAPGAKPSRGREPGALPDRSVRFLDRVLHAFADRVVLFRTRRLVFVTFGAFAGLGAVVTCTWAGAILVGQGLSPDRFLDLALTASVLVVALSWVVAQVLDYRLLLRTPLDALRRPVFVSWGGMLAFPIALATLYDQIGVPWPFLLDALTPALAGGHALGRLGCLAYGCCYGRPTSGRIAVTYRDPHAKAVRVGGHAGVPLHPVPFYESCLDAVILVVASTLALRGGPTGTPTAVVLLGYGLGRFGLEFLKDNRGRMVVGPLAVNHLLCVGLVALGAAVLAVAHLGGTPSPPIDVGAIRAGFAPIVAAAFLSGSVVFLGFSLHRRRVGEW